MKYLLIMLGFMLFIISGCGSIDGLKKFDLKGKRVFFTFEDNTSKNDLLMMKMAMNEYHDVNTLSEDFIYNISNHQDIGLFSDQFNFIATTYILSLKIANNVKCCAADALEMELVNNIADAPQYEFMVALNGFEFLSESDRDLIRLRTRVVLRNYPSGIELFSFDNTIRYNIISDEYMQITNDTVKHKMKICVPERNISEVVVAGSWLEMMNFFFSDKAANAMVELICDKFKGISGKE
jgi:hypothetical protein